MRRGFTLVELSIVLVIIGLLIGGILVAQSMISTAKITKQIQQIEQLQVAIRNFQTTYRCLPGDCTIMGGVGVQPERITSGNNDGRVVGYGTNPVVSGNNRWGGFTSSEWARVYDYLASANMFRFSNYDETDMSSYRANVGYPQMALDTNSPFTQTGLSGDQGGIVFGWEPANSYVTEGHKIKLGICAGESTGLEEPGSVNTISFYCGPSVQNMHALDVKLDDGRPYSGKAYINSDYYLYRIPGGIAGDSTTRVGISATNQYRTNWSGAFGSCITQGCYAAFTLDTDL